MRGQAGPFPMRTLFATLCTLGMLLSCDKKFPDLPTPDFDGLLPEGNVLSDIGLAELALDPNARDPLTGLGACADLLTYCVQQEGSLDDCVARAPRCTTAEPWLEAPCCPDACVRSYERARRDREPLAAFDAALFQGGSCYPGVKELVP